MMAGPHTKAHQPASARYGPKGMVCPFSCFDSSSNRMPNTAPSTDDSRITSGNSIQPSQAPSAASSLKSP
ncbi:hypothetical protein D3C72_1778750 [compost metagenome]